MNFVLDHTYLIPLLPLIAALVAGLFGAKILKGQSHWPVWLGVGASAGMSVVLLLGLLGQDTSTSHISNPNTYNPTWFTWISAGNITEQGMSPQSGGFFHITAGALIDPLSAVMLCVVCGIGFLITVFSAGYMKGDDGYFRFFAYLGLFIFAMTCLVMGDNIILLYLGWEGVGLCSYLLIGYYYKQVDAREAAKKAFIVNRIGDFGFAIGIMLLFYCFGTLSFFGDAAHPGFLVKFLDPSNYGVPTDRLWALNWIPFALLLGAFGKSAQFPLYVWLPDAMAGPTPVSALIHAATMVTAGIYMIVRCAPIFYSSEAAIMTIAIVGCFTAILSATIALRQNDLKKVFAYSTVSQLGFMFVATAALAPVAAIFHLMTHAFFKALLFLSSGVVMHAMNGELDLRKMSGLRRVMPKTRWLMAIGCAALAGVPLTSGFFSKDDILVAAVEYNKVLGVIMIVCALMTAYYTFRLYFRVFHGPLVIPPAPPGHGHGHDDHHSKEPFLLIAPLVILAIGAIVAGYVNFGSTTLYRFLGESRSLELGYQAAARTFATHSVSPASFGQRTVESIAHEHEETHTLHYAMMAISGLLAIFGIIVARQFHLANRTAGDALGAKFAPFTRILEAKYWVDEFYLAAIVAPLRFGGVVLGWLDRVVVDGIVSIASLVPQVLGFGLKLFTQRGYVQGYALGMLAGLALILLWLFR